MSEKPRVLIEEWLPVDTIGAESMRDASAAQKPPLNRLHVWWARRPLTTSRAAILASVLPAWSDDWPAALKRRFPTAGSYHEWFVRACGILGDPVAARQLIELHRAGLLRLNGNPYKHPRAFTVSPDADTLSTVRELLELAWGKGRLHVVDPFAGGGSIPFEALRYGFAVTASDLNPVAVSILQATLAHPFRFGASLVQHLQTWGRRFHEAVRERLEPFFPEEADGTAHAYLWARTVRCPHTGKPIPLSPNWWLVHGDEPVAVRPVFDPAADEATFEIVRGRRACEAAEPDRGTVRKGNAVSPWAHGQAVDGDYIKAEAQAGRMGQQLYAVAVKRGGGGFDFRPPTEADREAVAAAGQELERRLPAWESASIVPGEPIPLGNKTSEPHRYGMRCWRDVFSPRQLLAMCTMVAVYREVAAEVPEELGPEKAEAVLTYLAFAIDKAADYSSRLCPWDPSRSKVVHAFDRHDFSFKWSFAEFDAARNLAPWVVAQVVDAYRGLARLASPEGLLGEGARAAKATVMNASAADLAALADGSVDHICVDPPYEANVMFAELADFFYVWQKRTLGTVYPHLYRTELTNKDDEAVANEARFREVASRRRRSADLAQEDYRNKMTAAFREMHRVLRDDGVLTVMFTHKSTAAWDSLASALIEAGFTIRAAWPVHTESEHSLHQAGKNAAQSTILLACRKRSDGGGSVWWDDLSGEVRRVAREVAERFHRQGIRGVDLYIATFGPALSVISRQWPVLTAEADPVTGEPRTLRPETALDLARAEVLRLRKQGLLLGRDVQFDPVTDWYLAAWDAFQAEKFPADEARKLALALGLDIERDLVREHRVLQKKAKDVVIVEPRGRRREGVVDPEATAFRTLLDAAHTAMLVYLEDGSEACRRFLARSGLLQDGRFRDCLQAMLNAIPRVRKRGEFVRPEATALDAMRLAFYPDLELPPEPAVKVTVVQGTLDEALAAVDGPGDSVDGEPEEK